MLKSELFEHAKLWSLSCLENVFYYALEVKSRSLIQACICIADQEFSGVASFGQHTQVKFLLESIRHIVSENCQGEFIHITRYLKLLHTLCPDVGSVEEYLSSVSKINRSYMLFLLLENESASEVCQLMNDLFPPGDVLQMYGVEKSATKKRFVALIKRQIYNFRKLIGKLLSDMEFRSYYFYDEWSEEYGTDFHEELKADLNTYLKRVESCLLEGKDASQVYDSWLDAEQSNNPAMLYFLKLLMEPESGMPESKILNLLCWMFPGTDLTALATDSNKTLAVPPPFVDVAFLKIFSQSGWSITEKKPWDFDTLQQFVLEMTETDPPDDFDRTLSRALDIQLKENDTKGHAVRRKAFKSRKKVSDSTQKRTPFKEIDQNSANFQTKKRKHCEVESENGSTAKRLCMLSQGLKSPPPASSKYLLVDLCKNNFLMNSKKSCDRLETLKDMKSALNITINSPQCRELLKSGSKIFSTSSGRVLQRRISFASCSKVHVSEASDDIIRFSDVETESSDPERLRTADETMGLSWIPVSARLDSTPKSREAAMRRPCRSLIFKSESSEDHISESEPESHESCTQPQPTIKTTDHVLLPDMSVHYEGVPTNPCVVCISPLRGSVKRRRGYLVLRGVRVSNKEDIDTIENEEAHHCFKNYRQTTPT